MKAKKDTWFKEGTECELLEDYQGNDGLYPCGLYRGIYIIGDTEYDKFWHKQGHREGEEVVMNEVCEHEEFIK